MSGKDVANQIKQGLPRKALDILWVVKNGNENNYRRKL
jgi:hypothetical protein